MKKRSFIVYSIFAALLYVFSITYLIFNLVYEYSDGAARTKRRFDHTAITIQENMEKISSKYYDAQSIKNTIINSFGNLDDFAYIELIENGNTFFAYKTNTLENNDSRLLKNYFKTFKIEDKNYFFTANLYTLRPASIYHYCKISFLIILIVTIITFIFIILINVLDSKSSISVENETADDFTSAEKNLVNENASTKPQNNEFTENVSPAESSAANTDQTIVSSQTSADTEIKTEVSPSSASSRIEEKNADEGTNSEKTEEAASDDELEKRNDLPEGIYSTVTGLCYEHFLAVKLENEINRAISSEADLSLFLIKLDGISKDNYKYKEVCNYLTLQFQYKDLIFEYKNDNIAAIKINSTIDEAITFADKIHQEIKNIINDNNVNCYIGITSRTIRMVSGERMLMEAEEALSHSMEEKNCPIIAFRADAEKFRMANL